MAKRTKTESVLDREARQMDEAGAAEAIKNAAVNANGQVVEAARAAAEAMKNRVVPPVVKAVRPKKVKKARFVREKVEKQEVRIAAPTTRSTKPSGKMMTRNLAESPKKDRETGPASGDPLRKKVVEPPPTDRGI